MNKLKLIPCNTGFTFKKRKEKAIYKIEYPQEIYADEIQITYDKVGLFTLTIGNWVPYITDITIWVNIRIPYLFGQHYGKNIMPDNIVQDLVRTYNDKYGLSCSCTSRICKDCLPNVRSMLEF